MSNLSIRWRLTLWNTISVAVLLIVCGILVYSLLQQAMVRQTDQLLLTQYEELCNDRRIAGDPASRIPHWVGEFKEHVNVFAAIYDSQGLVFARTPELAVDSVPSEPTGITAEPQFFTQVLPIIGSQRALTARLLAGSKQFTVVLLAPLADMEANLARVRTVLTTALPVSLLLAGAIGYWLSRKALAPIDRLRERTNEIRADKLDQRLPVDNPEDELGRMAQTINDMLARLERSFAEIRRFTADASHELRTPLAVLRTEVEVAMGKPMNESQQHHLLASVLEECQRLTTLTNQLLTLSRDDTGTAHYARESIDFSALIADVVQTMTPLAETKQQVLQFTANTKAPILGDASRLRQVIYNLLDNAIKYTPAQGRIEVAVHVAGNMVTVTIHDTGIGIPGEHVPHVFERFYRVDKARTREEGGTGLGLSIAKTIVAGHDGQIAITSEDGQGTTFTVQLPLN